MQAKAAMQHTLEQQQAAVWQDTNARIAAMQSQVAFPVHTTVRRNDEG